MTAKLLLVDDDATLLRFLSEFLRPTFQVLTASNGQDALRIAYKEHPNLVVLDVMMPGMDGWEVTNRLRELSDIPIILLTGKTAEADKLRGFNLGVDDYVTKPFSFAELTARIQAVLNRAKLKEPVQADRLIYGAFSLDIGRREAFCDNRLLPLTPTEYRLLEALMRAQGRAVSEADLVQAIWPGNKNEETAVLRRFIWLLRKKVESDPAAPVHIITVRSFGYRVQG